ncbi:MAG: hypothetical protein OEZ22_05865 [Spirochaetia bacterium]|nr:hypothetical protein [Spirochaetia bacterium]
MKNKMYINWFFLLKINVLLIIFFNFIFCAMSPKKLRFQYMVPLPYQYYKAEAKVNDRVNPAEAPWENKADSSFTEENILYVFCDDNYLKKSYHFLLEGKKSEAGKLLLEEINKISNDIELMAKYYNNIALTYMFQSDIKKTKEYINKAGILLESGYIIHNNRIITNAFLVNKNIVKYGIIEK